MTKSKESGLTTLQIVLIVFGVFVVVAGLGIVASIFIPTLTKSQQAARETSAISDIQAIGKAQILYQVTKGKGKFADLQTLGQDGAISSDLASGHHNGYIFTCTPVTVEGLPPMFDITARPETSGRFGTGNRSYYSNETHVIYEADGGEPPTATPQDRVPKTGRPVGY